MIWSKLLIKEFETESVEKSANKKMIFTQNILIPTAITSRRHGKVFEKSLTQENPSSLAYLN